MNNGAFARGDVAYYHEIAHRLAGGHGFINPRAFSESGAEIPSAEHPPLWPLLLGVLSKLGAAGEQAHRLAGTVLGTGVILCVGLLGRRVAGDRAGLAAAAVAAAYPVLIAADGSLMSETLYGLMLGVALLLAYRLLDRPGLLTAAALGAAIGLAALSRGEAIVLLVLIAAPVLWRTGPGALPRAVLLVAACLLVLAPWTVRNYARFDEFVPISTNDGTVLLGANCDRTYAGPDLGFWTDACFTPIVHPANEARQSERWRRDGLEYAWDHASELPKVAGVRLLRTAGAYQPSRQLEFAEGRNMDVQLAGEAAYFLLLPLALYGLWLARRRAAPVFVLLAPVGLVLLTTVATYGYTRFRHAAEIPLTIFAGVALAEIGVRLRRPQAAEDAARGVGSPRRR